MRFINQSSNYRTVFFLIVAFYCFVLARFGLENFDTGYIPSFSWRILQGQIVYHDFIYKGPPVTLYFHAFFMKILPETGQFLWIRVVNYLLFAMQVYLTVSAFDNLYNLSKYKVEKWGLLCLGFIVSLINFSPYPWPTTDGILFAVLAFWLVSKVRKPNYWQFFFIALFSVLSALTKQSFYLVPFFFLFWITIKFERKIIVAFSFFLFFWLSVFIYLVAKTIGFADFVKQTTGETHLNDLISTGLYNYIFLPPKIFLLIALFLVVVGLLFLKSKSKGIDGLLPFFKWLSICLFVLAIVFCFVKEIEIASRIAFVSALFGLVFSFGFKLENTQKLAPVLVGLGIAWSSSISLGYQYPIFFSTGIVLCIIVTVGQEIREYSKYFASVSILVCAIAFSYNYRPYRESVITELTYSLDTVSPKLKYIKTSKTNFQKYSELKKLINTYGKNFIVAPSFPMANYVFDEQSQLPADWLIETEVGRRQEMFIRLAASKDNFVFLEKSFLEKEEFMPEKKEQFSSIGAFIYEKFNLVAETKYFLVYNSIKNNEELP